MLRAVPVLFLIQFLTCAAAPISDSDQVAGRTAQNPARRAVVYACPMHREVIATKPGKCPKCGMALRLAPDEVDAGAEETGAVVGPDSRSATSMSLRIPDIKVYDQNGDRKNFYSDLIKGKTVAINFIFTTCTTICPSLTATFRRVQLDLADQALEARLISISVDPTIDTSERLRAFAAKFKAGPGWTFVTGDKSDIDLLLKAFGSAVSDKNDHTPMILIGNDVSHYWTRAYGLTSPAALVKVISEAAHNGRAH